MPKLPKGMFRRAGRPGWYIRLFRGGRKRWVALGADFNKACDQARALAAGLPVPTKGVGTVGEAAERWVESYVRTQRSAKGRQQAAQRVRDYIEPFFGALALERVTREDVRAFRLHLEGRTSLSLTSVWHVLSDVRCLRKLPPLVDSRC